MHGHHAGASFVPCVMAATSTRVVDAVTGDVHPEDISGLPVTINEDGELVDESYPLLRQAHKSLLSVTLRTLLLFLLFAVLFGGIIVGIWLIVDGERSRLEIVSRSDWNARPPVSGKMVPLPVFPATYVVVIHTASAACSSESSCEEAVRKDQDYFMDEKKYADIGYNFLVAGDGRVYEGRGFLTQGAFVHAYNNRSLGVAFVGNFEEVAPPKSQLDVAQAFLQYAVDNKQLAAGYRLIGHRQVANTTSPGQALYDIIRKWPHWQPCYRNC